MQELCIFPQAVSGTLVVGEATSYSLVFVFIVFEA